MNSRTVVNGRWYLVFAFPQYRTTPSKVLSISCHRINKTGPPKDVRFELHSQTLAAKNSCRWRLGAVAVQPQYPDRLRPCALLCSMYEQPRHSPCHIADSHERRCSLSRKARLHARGGGNRSRRPARSLGEAAQRRTSCCPARDYRTGKRC